MDKELIRINTVIVAKNHNPTISTKDWLINQKIFDKNKEQPINFANTIVLSIYETKNHLLEITENQWILSIKNLKKINLNDIKSKIDRYVEALPETPYIAVGFNIHWKIKKSNEDENIFKFFNERFNKDQNEIGEIIGTSNFKYGSLLLYDEKDYQITIRITPFRDIECMEISFNFQLQLNTKELTRKIVVEKIKKFADNLKNYKEKAENIINNIINIKK